MNELLVLIKISITATTVQSVYRPEFVARNESRSFFHAGRPTEFHGAYSVCLVLAQQGFVRC